MFPDGFHLKVRMAKRVVSVPVLAALGVLATTAVSFRQYAIFFLRITGICYKRVIIGSYETTLSSSGTR